LAAKPFKNRKEFSKAFTKNGIKGMWLLFLEKMNRRKTKKKLSRKL
jgi:hypothetical protein